MVSKRQFSLRTGMNFRSVEELISRGVLVLSGRGKRPKITAESISQLDARKDTYLKKRGWRVIRLKGHQVRSDIEQCVAKVASVVKEVSSG